MAFQSAPARAVILGIFINTALAAVKFTAGILGHSFALIADAVESLSDIGSSLITLQAVRVAQKPPDDEHPYGHGKAEAIGAVLVATVLVLAGVTIALQGLREMLAPHQPPQSWVLIVLAVVVVVKELIFRFGRRIAEAHDSVAVKADAWHHRADAITSVLAFIGISLTIYAGPFFATAEYCAAFIAAALIIYNGVSLMRQPIDELLDRQALHLDDRVRTVARAVPGVVDVEKLFIRKAGPGYRADMHLHVAAGLSIAEAHCIGGRVRSTCRQEIKEISDVLVHLEPAAAAANPQQSLPAKSPDAGEQGDAGKTLKESKRSS